MIGIIGAMPIEVEELKSRLQNSQTENLAGLQFSRGMLSGVECVVAHCNPGKVNAALCTQLMITHYQPRLVINSGVAGGVGPGRPSCGSAVLPAPGQDGIDPSPPRDK